MQQDAAAQKAVFFSREAEFLSLAENFAETIGRNCNERQLFSRHYAVYDALANLVGCYREWLKSSEPAFVKDAIQLARDVQKLADSQGAENPNNLADWMYTLAELHNALNRLYSACPQPPDDAAIERLQTHAKWLQLWQNCFHILEEAAANYARMVEQQREQLLAQVRQLECLKQSLAQVQERLQAQYREPQGDLARLAQEIRYADPEKLYSLRHLLTKLHYQQQECAQRESHRKSLKEQLLGKLQRDPIDRIDQVHFSALTDETVEPEHHYKLRLIMYPRQQREVVEEIIRAAQETLLEEKTDLPISVRREQRITVRLSSHTAKIDDSEMSLPWTGSAQEFRFSYYVPANTEGHNLSITAHVYVDGIIATRLVILIRLGEHAQQTRETHAPMQHPQIRQEDITRIFFSYSSDDRPRVIDFNSALECFCPSLETFVDVIKLREGDNWQERVREEIDQCQVLYLCWSRAAKASYWVDYEWRYALATKGLDGVEPMPLEPPALCTPPKELSSKHFNSALTMIRFAEQAVRKQLAEREQAADTASKPEE